MIDDSAHRRCAEIAFLVADDYQGFQITGGILQHLARIAGERGLQQFEAEVLAQINAMLRCARGAGSR